MNSSAWRRSSSATIGGWVEIVDTTATRTPLRWIDFDQRTEIAVAGEQHHVIDMRSHFHGVDRELDIHVAFDLAAAGRVDELLCRLGHDRVAVVVEPVDQRPNGRIFLIVHQSRVIEGADQPSLGLKLLQQALVVDVEPESFALA